MEKLDKLYEFQQVDMELYNMENSLKKLPCRKKVVEAKNILVDGQSKAEEFEKEIENKTKGIDLMLDTYPDLSLMVESMIKDSEGVSEIDDAREMKNRAKDINNKIREMQSKVISSINEVKALQKSYNDLMVSLQQAKKDFVENKELYTKEVDNAKPKMDELKAKIESMEKDLDKELYEVYKQKKQNSMPVVAPLEGSQCMGCFMEIASSVMDSIKSSSDVVECENCGRILFVK